MDEMRRLMEAVMPGYSNAEDVEQVSYSKTKRHGDAQVTVSANATSMQELHDVLQLAGITLSADHPSMQEPEPEAEEPQDCVADPEAEGPTTLSYRYETDKEKLIDIIKQRLQQKLG